MISSQFYQGLRQFRNFFMKKGANIYCICLPLCKSFMTFLVVYTVMYCICAGCYRQEHISVLFAVFYHFVQCIYCLVISVEIMHEYDISSTFTKFAGNIMESLLRISCSACIFAIDIPVKVMLTPAVKLLCKSCHDAFIVSADCI